MNRPLRKLVCSVSIGALLALLALVGCINSPNAKPSGCSATRDCGNGAGPMEACYAVDSSGTCASLYYKVGAQTFACVSCDDQAYCANAALEACGVPEAAVPADATLPDGVARAQDSGTEEDSGATEDGGGGDSASPGDSGAADAGHD